MDLVNKLSLENSGRLIAHVTTRDEYPRCREDDQGYFEVENAYGELPKPLRERRLPGEHQPDEEGVENYRRWRKSNS